MIAAALLVLQVYASPPVKPVRLSQSQLDAISHSCRTPTKWLRVGEDQSIHLAPSKTAKYERVHCILRRLQPTGATKMGFIGNEQYDPEAK